jgi:hypothetical protein
VALVELLFVGPVAALHASNELGWTLSRSLSRLPTSCSYRRSVSSLTGVSVTPLNAERPVERGRACAGQHVDAGGAASRPALATGQAFHSRTSVASNQSGSPVRSARSSRYQTS